MNALSLRLTGKPRADAWLSTLLATAAFVALVAVASVVVGVVTPAVPPEAYRARAWRRLAGSALGEAPAVGPLVLLLRARGRSLADLGLRCGTTVRRWLATDPSPGRRARHPPPAARGIPRYAIGRCVER
ncbi:MAG: hypothetical protein ACM3NS_03940 [Deltaproteobacteria bacterium]